MTGKDLLKTLFTLGRKRTLELLKHIDERVGLDNEFLLWQPIPDAPHAGWMLGHLGALTLERVQLFREGLKLQPLGVEAPAGEWLKEDSYPHHVPPVVVLLKFAKESGSAMMRTVDEMADDGLAQPLHVHGEQIIASNLLIKLILQEAGIAGQLDYILRLFMLRFPARVKPLPQKPASLTESALLRAKKARMRREEPLLEPAKQDITKEPTDIIIFDEEQEGGGDIKELVQEVKEETQRKHQTKPPSGTKPIAGEPPGLHDI